MATNHTEHYSLSQWEAEDKVLRTDFNEDNAKIDEVLGAHAVRLDKLGNCRIEHISYTGTGKYGAANPTVIKFSKLPLFVLIFGPGGEIAHGCPTLNWVYYHYGQLYNTPASWNGDKLSFYNAQSPDKQCNQQSAQYHAFGIFSEDGK